MHILNIHLAHHFEFWAVVALLCVWLYFPPPATARIFGFVDVHYRDSFGLFLLLIGIALTFVGDIWPAMQHVESTGDKLLLAAMGFLNLTQSTRLNGNGAAPTSAPPAPAPISEPPVAGSEPTVRHPAGWQKP